MSGTQVNDNRCNRWLLGVFIVVLSSACKTEPPSTTPNRSQNNQNVPTFMGEPPPKELLNQSPDKTLNQANAGPEHPEEQPPPGESGRPLEHRPDNIDLGEKRGKRADRSAYNYK